MSRLEEGLEREMVVTGRERYYLCDRAPDARARTGRMDLESMVMMVIMVVMVVMGGEPRIAMGEGWIKGEERIALL